MATSGWQTWNNLYTSSFGYNYFKCSIRIDSITHSGNTVTVAGAFGVKNDGGYSSYYYYPINASITGSGQVQVVPGQRWIDTNEIVAVGFTTSFSASAGATSATVTVDWIYNNGYASNSYQYTLSFDPSSTAPTGLAVSNAQKYQNSFAATVSVTGWGGAGGASSRYRELQVWTYNASSLVEPRKYQKATGDTMSSVITVDNNSGYGTLTIEPNTMYTIGMYATNGTYNTGSQRVGDWTTLPPTPSLTNTAVTTNSATFSYSVPNQGGKYDMAVKYQLNSGSLIDVTTLTGSGTKNGNFTVSNLAAGTTYTIVVSLTTTVGEVVSNTVTFTTTALPATTKFYGSVSGLTKEVVKMYGPVKYEKEIYLTAYISDIDVDSFATSVYNYYPSLFTKEQLLSILGAYPIIRFTYTGSELQMRFVNSVGANGLGYWYYVFNSQSRFGMYMLNAFTYKSGESSYTLASYLFSSTPNTNVDAAQFETALLTRKIIKLYGSVNGQTKLIFEDV